MKSNWTIRIVAATFLCFGLAALFAKIAGEEKLTEYSQGAADALTNNGKFDSVYIKESFAANDLNEIYIIASTIDVKVEKSKDDNISILYYKINDGTKSSLANIEGSVIKFKADELIFSRNHMKFNFNFKNMDYIGIKFQDAKESIVVIQAPINIKKIKIKTKSGEIKIVDLKLDEVQADSVSGEFKVEKSSINEIKHTSISGDIGLQGNIQSMKSKTVSGDLKFISDVANPEIKFSTISGDADIVFMSDPDVNVIFGSKSGEIKFWGGLPVTKMDGNINGFKLGKGTGQLHFESTSGDVKISQEIQ